jgi:hypothetical protein
MVTGAAPAFTVAVNVTTLPDSTVFTAPPPDVMARVVVVAVGAAQARWVTPQKSITKAAEMNTLQGILTFTGRLHLA